MLISSEYIVTLLLLLVALGLLFYSIRFKKKFYLEQSVSCYDKDADTDNESYIKRMVETYGEPDEIIVASFVAVGKESLPILLYKTFVIIQYHKILKRQIIGYGFKNKALVGYQNNDYLLTLEILGQSPITIPIGDNLEYAEKLAYKLRHVEDEQ